MDFAGLSPGSPLKMEDRLMQFETHILDTMKTTLIAAALFAMTLGTGQAVIVWTGATSSDIFDDTNWDFSASGVSTISSNTSVLDNVTITNGSATIPNEGGQVRFQLGDGFNLTLDNSTLAPVAGGNDGVGGAPGGTGVTISLINGAAFDPFFIVNAVALSIDGSSSSTFGGGGNPINLSTVNLTGGATLAFLAETPAQYTAEHLGKTFVDGAAAVEGLNIEVNAFNGASGSVITVIPEPSGFALIGLAGLALILRRRR